MTMRERESLIARIRQLRRDRAADDQASSGAAEHAEAARIDAIETRISHLEQLVEGLQDSVHREAKRHGRLIAELQAQIEPEAMAAALNKDARDRGL